MSIRAPYYLQVAISSSEPLTLIDLQKSNEAIKLQIRVYWCVKDELIGLKIAANSKSTVCYTEKL